MSWSVGELARACGGELRGVSAAPIQGVSTDTRSIRAGELFVALRGEHFDGHAFLAEAVARGAAALLVEDAGEAPASVPAIVVRDTVWALGQIAAERRRRFAGPVVAITGSNGKTTTKELCAGILEAAGRSVRRSPGNLNNHIGLPLSILGLAAGDEVLVLELGMNHAGEIDRLASIAQPTVGAITQVAPAHLGLLGSLDAIASAKGELFDHLGLEGCAVVNADDPRVVEQARRHPGRALRFGRAHDADFRATPHPAAGARAAFRLATPAGECDVQLPVPGAHLVENALCAAACAFATGRLGPAPLDAIQRGLEAFRGVEGRLSVRCAPGGVVLVDDSYNANPHSMEAALETLARLPGSGRRVAVLGDMLELGEEAERLHGELGRAVARHGVELLICVGPLSVHTTAAAHAAGIAQSWHTHDAAAVAERIREIARSGDRVLVKGSRSMRMERVARALVEKS